jgi:hypothetical protein
VADETGAIAGVSSKVRSTKRIGAAANACKPPSVDGSVVKEEMRPEYAATITCVVYVSIRQRTSAYVSIRQHA